MIPSFRVQFCTWVATIVVWSAFGTTPSAAQDCLEFERMQAAPPPSWLVHAFDGQTDGGTSSVLQMSGIFESAAEKLRAAESVDLAGEMGLARQLDLQVAERFTASELPASAIEAWARFRLTQAYALNRLDCSSLVVSLLQNTVQWSNLDDGMIDALIGSLAGAYLAAGSLQRVIDLVAPLRSSAKPPETYEGIRGRIAALSNLGAAYRQTDRRADALQVYLEVLTLVASENGHRIDTTQVEQRDLNGDLAYVEMNLAALYLFDQQVEAAQAHLDNARRLLDEVGQSSSLQMVEWYRILSDLERERGNPELAREALQNALRLAQAVSPASSSMIIDLQRRIITLDDDPSATVELLLTLEAEVMQGREVTPLHYALNARSLQDSYMDLQDWSSAQTWGVTALQRMTAMTIAATVERAVVEQKLSLTLANMGQFPEAYAASKQAIDTLGDVALLDAAGCSSATERNPSLVRTIREWHGIIVSTLLQFDNGEDQAVANDLANEILGLVQAQEIDRIGAASLLAVLRGQPEYSEVVSLFDAVMVEKCNLEADLAALAAHPSTDSSALVGASTKLQAINERLAALIADMDPVVAGLLTGGRQTLDVQSLNGLMRDGEALLGYRFGESFSIASLALRRDGELTLFSIPLNNANQSSIAALVDRILLGVEDRLPDTEAVQLLSQQLRLDQIAPILNEARHVFVVADGALRRLPSHLLPVGEDRLGAHVPSSTLPSTWTFALRRQVASEPLRSRSVMAAGDPTLHFVNCRDFPELSLPADQLHRDVLCLGMPGGLSNLLNDAQALLGGPTPLLQDAATRTALEGPAPETAGILLFGTHGVVPDPTGGEVPGLDEPALVLTPNKKDSAQDGLLRASDIAQMSWDNAWLAILAACRTGRPSDNELSVGLTGFALGFTSAGVDSILVTQWAVPADPTVAVVSTLLESMAGDPKMTLAEALENAMQRAKVDYAHFDDWAAFNILGDGTVTMPAP